MKRQAAVALVMRVCWAHKITHRRHHHPEPPLQQLVAQSTSAATTITHSLVLLVCKICPRYKRDLQRADGTYAENNARYCEREVAGGAINVHKLAGGACKATTGSKQPKSKSSNLRGVSFGADAIKSVPGNHRHRVEHAEEHHKSVAASCGIHAAGND